MQICTYVLVGTRAYLMSRITVHSRFIYLLLTNLQASIVRTSLFVGGDAFLLHCELKLLVCMTFENLHHEVSRYPDSWLRVSSGY